MTRLNKILAAALVVQLLLAVFMLTRKSGTGIAPLEAIAAGIETAKVTKVQVFAKREKGTAGEVKPAVELARQGSTWVVASAFNYPADEHKVTALLEQISGLKSRGPIATSAGRQIQLAVADDVYERKVVVTTDAGERVFYLGTSAGARRTAVRRGGDAKVYGVTGLSVWSVETEPRGWIDRTYLDVPKEEVASVAVKNAKGTVELVRSGASWSLLVDGAPAKLAAGEEIDTSVVDEVLTKVSKIEAAAPGDPARDAANPIATITVRPKPPEADADAGVPAASVSVPERVVDVLADGQRYWVRERGNAKAVIVEKVALETVVDLWRDQLIKKPTPAEPAPGTAPPSAPPGLPPGVMPPSAPAPAGPPVTPPAAPH